MEGRPDRIGVGIGGMRQRVKEFGGDLRIGNADPGTFVEVTVPIEPAAQEPQRGIRGFSQPAQGEVAR
jgi:signal transduction histidine kinase